MLTPEREKEIRENGRNTGTECDELLAEIDRLRKWAFDAHVKELEQRVQWLERIHTALSEKK